MNKIILDVQNVHQRFGTGDSCSRVLYDIDLKVVQGQFIAIVGASGCGKSTLLRAILGTDPPIEGSINADGIAVTDPTRHVGIVYQRYGLYQFMTAEENVAFGLMLDQTGLPFRAFVPWKWWPMRKRHLEEAREMLNKVRLGHACKRYPSELSGGMQQRVAIAQSLIMKPKILLLDEPFGALDESTREELQKMMLKLYEENMEAKRNGRLPPWTVLFVTHELTEAFYVSDRLVGLSKNWVEETKDGQISGAYFGATKTWDKATPVYTPDAPKDFELFHQAKEELKASVLSDRAILNRNQHVSFWEDLANGVGTGVAMLKE